MTLAFIICLFWSFCVKRVKLIIVFMCLVNSLFWVTWLWLSFSYFVHRFVNTLLAQMSLCDSTIYIKGTLAIRLFEICIYKVEHTFWLIYIEFDTYFNTTFCTLWPNRLWNEPFGTHYMWHIRWNRHFAQIMT